MKTKSILFSTIILAVSILLQTACGGPGTPRSVTGSGPTTGTGGVRGAGIDNYIGAAIGNTDYVSNADERRCVRALPDNATDAQIQYCIDRY